MKPKWAIHQDGFKGNVYADTEEQAETIARETLPDVGDGEIHILRSYFDQFKADRAAGLYGTRRQS